MFDPSKLTPQAIREISELMSSLTPAQMMKMQTLMHNQMGGFDVTKDMMEFEQSLPPSFREKMARIMYMANGITVPPQQSANIPVTEPKTEDDARLIILRSVASGLMSPEEALKVLF